MPLWGWAAVLAIVALFAAIIVLDWLDGSDAGPDHYLIGALVIVVGLILGFSPPFWGGGKGNGETP